MVLEGSSLRVLNHIRVACALKLQASDSHLGVVALICAFCHASFSTVTAYASFASKGFRVCRYKKGCIGAKHVVKDVDVAHRQRRSS